MYEYLATIEKVVDGDTLHVTIDLGMDCSVKTTIRINGINAPEMSTDEGRAAKDYASSLLPVGEKVILRTIKDKREKYGRYLGIVILGPGKNFGDMMIKNGHAVARKY